jgi:hypothetical protein
MNVTQTISLKPFFIVLLSLFFVLPGIAQKKELTKISGVVRDAKTGETLPFVNITMVGANIGSATDFDGKYKLETLFATDSIYVSYVGYVAQTKAIVKGDNQTIDIRLESSSYIADEITITAKKKKYKRKNNPAINLMKKAIANRYKNRLESKDYYSYDKYEKTELDLNNLTEKFKEKKIFNKFQFIFDYVDTSDVNGKPYLPFFIKESVSTMYYRKSPKVEKEHRKGVQISGLDKYMDDKSVTDVLDILYQDIDIYDNIVILLDNQFLSPFSPFSPNFYRYYIIDTTEVKGKSAINLAFIPINKNDFGFTGNIYLSNDSLYSVLKVDLTIVDQINLNYVTDLKIEQEFEDIDGIYIKTRDRLTIDYNISKKGVGFYGSRTVVNDNFSFEPPDDVSVYSGIEKIIETNETYNRPSEYWAQARLESLNEQEAGIYEMIDTLTKVPAFKTILEIGNLLVSGFKSFGPIDLGPINTFYSFNDIEGFKLRLGGETNLDFSEKVKIEGYGTYGFKDKKFKYMGGVTYSFTEHDFRKTPRHYIKATYIHDTDFPGQDLEHINGGNFFLSFKRGDTDKMIFYDSYGLEYTKEYPGFSYSLLFDKRNRRPVGTLDFRVDDGENAFSIPSINTTEFGINLRYAPNEQFIQGRQFRKPLFNTFPVLTVKYRAGVNDLFGGDYKYHKLSVNLFKKIRLALLGYANVEVEGGKIWGELPFILMRLPQANQTYAYQLKSFNMMNFIEFVNDQYVSLNVQWYLNGFILNRIPLIKKLKFREVVSVKVLYGKVTDKNNPNLNNQLVQLPVDAMGLPTTFVMDGTPYIEGSVGLTNILKIFRIDIVKRFTYLDNPNPPELFGVKGLGIRTRLKVSF